MVKDSNFGKIIYLDYKKKLFKNILVDPVKLEIHIEGKYPFQAPKVLLASITGFPSLADGRNLLQNIIKRSWSEDIPIVEIANAFPQFLNESHLNLTVGRFHLGQCMSLKTWDQKDSMKLFICQEIDPQNPKFFRDRALVLTHSMILQLETNNSYPGLAHLVSYASLFSLLTLKVAKSDRKKVTFEWRIPEGVNALAQQFRINEVDEFINLMLSNSEQLGITFDRKSLRPAPSISEDEVTAQAIKKIKIQEIMDGIVKFEVAIQDEMNKENVDKLIDLYQRAIEYYSALSDPKFETYLQKVRKLLSDEVVLDVLAGKPPPKKLPVKEAVEKAVKMFEDLEIWPSGPPAEREVLKEEVVVETKDDELEEEFEKETMTPADGSKLGHENLKDLEHEAENLLKKETIETESASAELLAVTEDTETANKIKDEETSSQAHPEESKSLEPGLESIESDTKHLKSESKEPGTSELNPQDSKEIEEKPHKDESI